MREEREMKKGVLFFILSFILLAGEAGAEDLKAKALDHGLQPIPASKADLQKVTGKLDKKKVELGKKLFFDPRLSKSGIISCNTCHNLATGGTDGVSAAIGHGWTANPHHLNSPTVYNAVFNTVQMWDGRFSNLEEQAKSPIQAAPEMAAAPELVVNRLKSIPDYVAEFGDVFGSKKGPVTFDNVAKAIAAFEATLVTPSRFDDFLSGKKRALNAIEQRGLDLFIEKGCVSCHTGMGVGGSMMQPFPVVNDYKYANVGDFKGNKDGEVRVPTLRNINRTAPYLHNGAVWSLDEAIRIMGWNQLGIKLTNEETSKIAAFLRALDGRLPEIIYPVLPPSTESTPRPDAT